MSTKDLQEMLDSMTARHLKIGITGFARSGKTIFLAAAAHALQTADAWSTRRGQGPLAGFGPFERRQLLSAHIRNDIDETLPQFPFHQVRDSLLGHSADWPQPTEGISRLVLDLHFKPGSRFPSLRRSHVLVELVDYPGEWLIDLPMLEQSYEEWSERMLRLANTPSRTSLSEEYLTLVNELSAQSDADEEIVQALSDSWKRYLTRAAEEGLTLNQPGRMLRPDTLRNSPVLRFSPLPADTAPQALREYMAKRFTKYKKEVIRPFYRDHFAKIDRQIVLVDVLRSLERGQEVFDETEKALEETLGSFNYSKGGLLNWVIGIRTTRVLFAATKADHVIRGDRTNLEKLLRSMLARTKTDPRGKTKVDVMPLASVRATEDLMTDKPPRREILRGRPARENTLGQWDPGGLPLDMPPDWNAVYFQFMNFLPPDTSGALLEGLPAINLGKALDFLIGEDLS